MSGNELVLGKNRRYSLDCYKTKVNNNVLVVGASGAGKTRGIVIPNLLQASGSYVVSDPKGNLYGKYKDYLEAKGYDVKKLDFTNPAESVHYNFFNYIRSTQDIVKVAHMITGQEKITIDPFWDLSAQLLVQALIAYQVESLKPEERNLKTLMKLVSLCMVDENMSSSVSKMDLLMEELKRSISDSYAYETYTKYRVATGKTLRSILITVNAKLGLFDTPEINKMMAYDDIDISSLGTKKTALFVVVSDTDRSLDNLVNIFFTQAMNELCLYADTKCEDNRLPVPVRFFLDDFATNCKIADFPRMISSIRSRGLSAMLMIQSESQLTKGYGSDGRTIMGNCDTYVYLGGNDIETARAVAERCDVPMKKVLNMPVGYQWLFRRGEEPKYGENLELDDYLNEIGFEKTPKKMISDAKKRSDLKKKDSIVVEIPEEISLWE